MNSIPYTKEDRRANAAHLERLAVQRMVSIGELINACHDAIKTASDDIWTAMIQTGGCPVPYPECSPGEEMYWAGNRERLMLVVNTEAAYQIWRDIQLFKGDPTRSDTFNVLPMVDWELKP